MLVSSPKASYDARKNEVADLSSEIINIDRLPAKYGPETGEMRGEFRQFVEFGLDHIWPSQAAREAELRPRDTGNNLVDQLELLPPKNDRQAAVKAQALSMVTALRQTQWL